MHPLPAWSDVGCSYIVASLMPLLIVSIWGSHSTSSLRGPLCDYVLPTSVSLPRLIFGVTVTLFTPFPKCVHANTFGRCSD